MLTLHAVGLLPHTVLTAAHQARLPVIYVAEYLGVLASFQLIINIKNVKRF